MRNEGKRGLYASGVCAHTMGPLGKSKSGELIVARAADEAAAIYGPDLWTARIYHRGHTHTRVRARVFSSSLSTFLSFPLFRSETRGGGCEDDVTAPRRWWCWVADNGNEPRKGEGICTREKDRKHRGKKREKEVRDGRAVRWGKEGRGEKTGIRTGARGPCATYTKVSSEGRERRR